MIPKARVRHLGGSLVLLVGVITAVGVIGKGPATMAAQEVECEGCSNNPIVMWNVADQMLDPIPLVVWQSGQCEPNEAGATPPCVKDQGCLLEGSITIQNRGAVTQWYTFNNGPRQALLPGQTINPPAWPNGNRLECPDVSQTWRFYPSQNPADGPMHARVGYWCGGCKDV